MGPITYSNPPVDETAPGIDDAAALESAEQAQLPFFDAEAPPTMNTQQPDSDNPQMPIEADAAQAAAEPEMVAEFRAPATLDAPESLGSRLRAAREARGMRCDEAAHKLKLPLATIQALEADRYERIGEGIYLRGYLTKYLQLLELPRVLAERALGAQEALPPLVTSGTVSRPRYLFQRYSVSALYLILTGVIIVPAVLLAMRGGFEPSLAQITPLDTPESTAVAPPAPTATSTTTTESTNTTTMAAPLPAATPSAADETPLVASLTPFPASKHDANEAADSDRTAAEKTVATPPPSGVHLLRLSLTVPSWVEIIASDGEKLEFGLLPAGAVRNYSSNKPVDVRLGNSSGATVEIDGKAQDLTPFRHANVAHFKLSGGEITISHSGG
jgi:cytoskeleton protein RodZ